MDSSSLISYAVALIALALLIRFAHRSVSLGVTRKAGDLEPSIAQIYELCDPRLSLIVRERSGGRFLQFRATRRMTGEKEIELWIPKDENVHDLGQKVIDMCRAAGRIETRFIDDRDNAFVVVPFHDDVTDAAQFGTQILLKLFSMSAEDEVKVRIDIHKIPGLAVGDN